MTSHAAPEEDARERRQADGPQVDPTALDGMPARIGDCGAFGREPIKFIVRLPQSALGGLQISSISDARRAIAAPAASKAARSKRRFRRDRGLRIIAIGRRLEEQVEGVPAIGVMDDEDSSVIDLGFRNRSDEIPRRGCLVGGEPGSRKSTSGVLALTASNARAIAAKRERFTRRMRAAR